MFIHTRLSVTRISPRPTGTPPCTSTFIRLRRCRVAALPWRYMDQQQCVGGCAGCAGCVPQAARPPGCWKHRKHAAGSDRVLVAGRHVAEMSVDFWHLYYLPKVICLFFSLSLSLTFENHATHTSSGDLLRSVPSKTWAEKETRRPGDAPWEGFAFAPTWGKREIIMIAF